MKLHAPFTPARKFNRYWCNREWSSAYKHKVLFPRWASRFRYTYQIRYDV